MGFHLKRYLKDELSRFPYDDIYDKYICGEISKTQTIDRISVEISERFEICTVGAELCIFDWEDFEYVMSPSTRRFDAEKRLTTKRNAYVLNENSLAIFKAFRKTFVNKVKKSGVIAA